MPLYSVRIELPAGLDLVQAGSFCELLEEGTVSAGCHGNEIHKIWHIELLFDEAPDLNELSLRLALAEAATGLKLPEQKPEAHEVAERNWLAECYRAFPAFEIGPFFIHGSHEQGPFPDDKIVLQIDAATAFGSGEHGTTKGCLLALAKMKEDGFAPKEILDLGTGSGILAIGAAKLWPEAVITASDNDEEAVRVAGHHAALNDAAHIQGMVSEGFADARLRRVYDLLIANILAGPLMEMAGDITAAGQAIVLSGILNDQAEDVIAAYTAEGAQLTERGTIGDWTTLVLTAPSQ